MPRTCTSPTAGRCTTIYSTKSYLAIAQPSHASCITHVKSTESPYAATIISQAPKSPLKVFSHPRSRYHGRILMCWISVKSPELCTTELYAHKAISRISYVPLMMTIAHVSRQLAFQKLTRWRVIQMSIATTAVQSVPCVVLRHFCERIGW